MIKYYLLILYISYLYTGKDAYCIYIHGFILAEMNQFNQAIEWYEKALTINPQYVDSLCGKSECLLIFYNLKYQLKIMNKYEQALEWYSKMKIYINFN